jgi:translation initiation factor 2 alpha subunit (eIF-2alpha)
MQELGGMNVVRGPIRVVGQVVVAIVDVAASEVGRVPVAVEDIANKESARPFAEPKKERKRAELMSDLQSEDRRPLSQCYTASYNFH